MSTKYRSYFNQIYSNEGRTYRDTDGKIVNATRLILAKRNGKDRILVIELEKRAGHWTMVTGGRWRKEWLDKRSLIWSKTKETLPHKP